MTPQTTHTPEPVVYLPSVVPLDDEKCSSRIALGNVEEQLSELGVLMRFNQTMDEMLVEVEDVDLSAIYGHEDDEGYIIIMITITYVCHQLIIF